MDLFLYFFKAYPKRTILVFITVTIGSIITAFTLLILPALLFTMMGRSTAKTQFINDLFIQVGIHPSAENLMIYLIIGIALTKSITCRSKYLCRFYQGNGYKRSSNKITYYNVPNRMGFFYQAIQR